MSSAINDPVHVKNQGQRTHRCLISQKYVEYPCCHVRFQHCLKSVQQNSLRYIQVWNAMRNNRAKPETAKKAHWLI